MRNTRAAFALAGALLLSTGAAQAHPHIWIDAKAKIVFNDQGELTNIYNTWTFDEAFSVWQIQGLDTNGDGITSSEEMQELADENLKGLAEYKFYTLAGERDSTLPMASMDDARFEFRDNRSTFTFGIEPQAPYRIKGRFEIAIADPEYYVAITFADLSDVELVNAPPGCTLGSEPPHELSPEIQQRLGELSADVLTLPPDLEVAVRGAQGSIVVDCSSVPGAPPPATALEAVTQVAEAKPQTPFGGPPQEPGFKISRTGPLGFLVVWQEEFYKSLTAAAGQLKSDWTAFWVLGGLSFLYGIFHAAGPGHGKVVIGSYMLANERQVKRGILLSFGSGLLQAAVAVALVAIAAALLQLSTSAMDLAVVWIERGAYALMVLLGLWLVARKLFGFGHNHSHEVGGLAAQAGHHQGDDHALLAKRAKAFEFRPAVAPVAPKGTDSHGRLPGHAHYGHDHGDDEHGHHHHHVVTAEQTGGDWREQLGVVLSSGLRPCTGALLVLVFSLSQGIFLAGVASAFLMGLGTAITVSVLAVVAVSAKGLARRYLDANGKLGSRLVGFAELFGALVVLAFGLAMLLASF
jgi:nickel/cobalt transporter (NicO) family protein